MTSLEGEVVPNNQLFDRKMPTVVYYASRHICMKRRTKQISPSCAISDVGDPSALRFSGWHILAPTIVPDGFCSRLAEGCARLHPRLRWATAPAELSLKNVTDVMGCGSRVCSHRRNVSDPALRGAARPNTSKNQKVGYYRHQQKREARCRTSLFAENEKQI